VCILEVDTGKIPKRKRPGPQGKGTYFEITYEIRLTFGRELVFALLVEGKVVGSVELLHY
jgi:hypothetical protein